MPVKAHWLRIVFSIQRASPVCSSTCPFVWKTKVGAIRSNQQHPEAIQGNQRQPPITCRFMWKTKVGASVGAWST